MMNEGQPLLMKLCFKTFLRCIMQLGDASGSISLTLMYMSHSATPTNIDSQIVHKMPEFLVPSQFGKWDDMLQGEKSIVYGVLPNHP